MSLPRKTRRKPVQAGFMPEQKHIPAKPQEKSNRQQNMEMAEKWLKHNAPDILNEPGKNAVYQEGNKPEFWLPPAQFHEKVIGIIRKMLRI